MEKGWKYKEVVITEKSVAVCCLTLSVQAHDPMYRKGEDKLKPCGWGLLGYWIKFSSHIKLCGKHFSLSGLIQAPE